MNTLSRSGHRAKSGFTLVEVLASTLMCAVLLAAVNALLYSAMRLRENTEETIEKKHPIRYAISIMKRDLLNLTPPTGVMTGTFTGTTAGGNQQRQDTLEFCCTTGRMRENAPWGDVQKVQYYLQTLQDGSFRNRLCLIRAITRNLLSTVETQPDYQILLKDVQSLEFTYYDGESWLKEWDSETQDSSLPAAIQIRILYMPVSRSEENRQIALRNERSLQQDNPQWIPIEFLVPVIVKPMEAASSSATETTEQTENTENGGNTDANTDGNQNTGDMQRQGG